MRRQRGSGNRGDERRSRAATARALATAGALAVSLGVLTLHGSAAEPQAVTATAAVSGTVGMSRGAGTAQPGFPPSYTPGAGARPAAVRSDPGVLITFPRALITTSGALASATPTIGLAGIGRPPAGYLMAPLASLRPSSPFGFRVSPLSGEAGDFHLGQDYAAPCGSTVYAADAGVVRAAGWHPWGGGNRVEIDHGNGLITTYNHLESIAVRSGDPVQAGQPIARVGSTGWSTGCHLHFETILDGRHTSPLAWRLVPLRALPGNGTAGLLSYAPGTATPSAGNPDWIIPVGSAHGSHDAFSPAGVQAGTTTTAAAAAPQASPAVPPAQPFDTSDPPPPPEGTTTAPAGPGVPAEASLPAPAPAEPVAAETVSAETTPTAAAPAETVPAEAVPAETTPTEPALAETVPSGLGETPAGPVVSPSPEPAPATTAPTPTTEAAAPGAGQETGGGAPAAAPPSSTPDDPAVPPDADTGGALPTGCAGDAGSLETGTLETGTPESESQAAESLDAPATDPSTGDPATNSLCEATPEDGTAGTPADEPVYAERWYRD